MLKKTFDNKMKMATRPLQTIPKMPLREGLNNMVPKKRIPTRVPKKLPITVPKRVPGRVPRRRMENIA
jgi:hypothetical protein